MQNCWEIFEKIFNYLWHYFICKLCGGHIVISFENFLRAAYKARERARYSISIRFCPSWVVHSTRRLSLFGEDGEAKRCWYRFRHDIFVCWCLHAWQSGDHCQWSRWVITQFTCFCEEEGERRQRDFCICTQIAKIVIVGWKFSLSFLIEVLTY